MKELNILSSVFCLLTPDVGLLTPVFTNTPMIHFSQSAAGEIQRLLSKQNNPEVFFRLQVQTGGCSGLFYDLGFDKVLRTGDQIFKSSGIAVVVDAQSWNYVNALTIDYSEDLMGGGFRFYNPQAIALCGCGNSFSINQSD